MPEKRREILLGPPGTGKTRDLIEALERALVSGIAPEEVAFLAFTKKAANVAIARATSHFGFPKSRFPYFRTIHSLAFHENKIASMDVMRTAQYREFGNAHGWDFTVSYDNPDDRPVYGRGLGDTLLRCYDMATARCISPLEEASRDEYHLTEYAITFFISQFEAYKKKFGLKTFNDFLSQGVALNVKLVIIDEAQDLTRLQWEFIRKSFKNCPHIIIAGDDDQCIYEWSGADVNFFLSLDFPVRVLTRSHRCREEIWKVCNTISNRIGNRFDKNWEPMSPGGVVDFKQALDDVSLSHGEWLVLARKNRGLRKMWTKLMNTGRIFHDGSIWINERSWFKAILTYQDLLAGAPVSAAAIIELQKYCPFVQRVAEYAEYRWDDLRWSIEKKDWETALPGLAIIERTFFKQALGLPQDLRKPGEIRLTTIHGAKGGEADNVLLDTSLDGIPRQQFRKNPDAERRVWYVGVSRARHNLVLTGSTNNSIVYI